MRETIGCADQISSSYDILLLASTILQTELRSMIVKNGWQMTNCDMSTLSGCLCLLNCHATTDRMLLSARGKCECSNVKFPLIFEHDMGNGDAS
jgi:hypothetical protein